ncbi:MAG: nucleotidyltransferase [Byssovorax sp.]
MKLQQDLREFVALLSSSGVDFIIVGGHAVAFHGHPRFTGDIDFLVRSTPENAERIVAALDAFGFGGVGLSPRDFTRLGFVVQLGRPPNRIDLLTSISGVDFEEAWAGRIAGEIDGLAVFFLGLDALLKNKRASGRDKDLADVRTLQAITAKSGPARGT